MTISELKEIEETEHELHSRLASKQSEKKRKIFLVPFLLLTVGFISWVALYIHAVDSSVGIIGIVISLISILSLFISGTIVDTKDDNYKGIFAKLFTGVAIWLSKSWRRTFVGIALCITFCLIAFFIGPNSIYSFSISCEKAKFVRFLSWNGQLQQINCSGVLLIKMWRPFSSKKNIAKGIKCLDSAGNEINLKEDNGRWICSGNSDIIIIKENETSSLRNIGNSPFYIRRSWNPNKIIVCNAHSPYFSIVRLFSDKVELEEKFELLPNHSHDFSLFDGGNKALITSSVTHSVLIFNTKTRKIEKVFKNSKDQELFLHPDSIGIFQKKRIGFISSWRGSSITALDLKNQTLIKRIPLFPGPSGLAISEEANKVLVSHTNVKYDPRRKITEGVVTIIDADQLLTVQEVPIKGKESADIKLIPNKNLAVTADMRTHSLTFIDILGGYMTNYISLPNSRPIDMFISNIYPFIYVANFDTPYIHVVNYNTMTIVTTLRSRKIGKETNGIVLSTDESYICVTNTSENEIVCLKISPSTWN